MSKHPTRIIHRSRSTQEELFWEDDDIPSVRVTYDAENEEIDVEFLGDATIRQGPESVARFLEEIAEHIRAMAKNT